ncbi:MAG: DUF4363 family protein [Clostridia bacterium]|nr:DUF4363 family protein [Clostridia bacterium]
MSRIFVALGLVVALGIMVGTGFYTINKGNKTLSAILNEVELSAMQDDIEKSANLCEKAEKEWIKCEEKITIFANHAEVCEIGVAISSLKPLIQYNEKAEFFSELNRVKIMLEHLAAMEYASFE